MDATSLLCATITTATHMGNMVLRKGRALHEMLLQRVVFVALTSEGRDVSLLVVAPRALDAGKTAWHQFSAFTDLLPTLRARGHLGISLTHFAFDRAVHEPMSRRLTALHDAYYDPAHRPPTDEDLLLQLTDLTVDTP